MSDDNEYRSAALERPMRPDPRGVTARVAPPTTGPRLTRRRRTANPLEYDPRIVPAGMSYEWKRETLLGKPEVEHQIGLRENHWRAVPASRHPHLAQAGEEIIRRRDLVLMERPKYLTEEAQMEDLQEAMAPIQSMEEVMFGTKPGEMTRNHPSVRKNAYVRQQYSPGEPIGEDGMSTEP